MHNATLQAIEYAETCSDRPARYHLRHGSVGLGRAGDDCSLRASPSSRVEASPGPGHRSSAPSIAVQGGRIAGYDSCLPEFVCPTTPQILQQPGTV